MAVQTTLFAAPTLVMGEPAALARIEKALARWKAATAAEAERLSETLRKEFPDEADPRHYWHSAASNDFKDFFTWGHNHDFGHGHSRSGAMGDRHTEIASETMALGFLPPDLSDMKILDIGCWTGGDALILEGLHGTVTALEEHPRSAAAAARMLQLVGASARVIHDSLYHDRPDWRSGFDLIYCAGVIYHVTDPLLFLRICFAYLKPGGRLIIETKASSEDNRSVCDYSGTLEKGWNWYAPSRQAMGRWLADAGFPVGRILVHRRPIGRLLACAVKTESCRLPEPAGFSRPGSWLEGEV